ncbi:MAG: LysR substrate-binding domain-containing protein [Verrucomicrobiota bacterium]
MELRHLRYFVAVAEEMHFGRAATRLNICQPPLSQQIRQLEDELNVKLFRRTTRRLELTPEGSLFWNEARTILNHTKHLVQVMGGMTNQIQEVIRIGFVTSASYSVMAPILKEFNRVFPNVEIQCRDMTPIPLFEALKNKVIDAAFLRSPQPDDNLQTYSLCRESFIMVMPDNHPLAKTAKVDLKDFSKVPFVFHPRHAAPLVFDLFMETCQKAGFTPILKQEGNDLQAVLALVASGFGVALLPATLQNLQRPGVVYRELKVDSDPIELSLGVRKKEMTKSLEALISISLEMSQKLIRSKKIKGLKTS